jgi:outer membrane beta-barrel protein
VIARVAAAALVSLMAFATGAQDLPPLDLNDPDTTPPPVEEAKPPEPDPASAKPTEKKKSGVLESALGAPGEKERDAALGDRVKAVQRKGFLKRQRFELTPLFSTSLNDAYYQKIGGGGRIAYNLQDSVALGVWGSYYTPFRTDAVRQGKLALRSQLLTSQLYWQAMAGGVWAPIYGKVAFFKKRIIHFDLYLLAGFGVVWTSTSEPPRAEGPHLASDFGGGLRFYPKDWLAFELGLRATLYPDQPLETVPSTIQKVLAASVGVSFFLPTSFEYVYP